MTLHVRLPAGISRLRNSPRLRAGGLLILLALSGPAMAETHQFGLASVTFDGRTVTFANDMTPREGFPQDFSVDLTNGITVQVIIMQEFGSAPDTMHVIPPSGYIAIPESVTVEEWESGHILVVPEGLS